MRVVKWIVGLAVACIVCLVAAAHSDPMHPTCGGVAMAPGDRCIHYGGSSSSTSTYDEEVASAARTRLILLAGTVGIPIAGGAWLLVTSVRRRPARAGTRTAVRTQAPVVRAQSPPVVRARAPVVQARAPVARAQAPPPWPQPPPTTWQASDAHGVPIPPAPSSSSGEPGPGA